MLPVRTIVYPSTVYKLKHRQAHILQLLFDRGHMVVTTVRSQEEAKHVRDSHDDKGTDKLEIVIVTDIAVEGAFDEVAKTPGLEAVLHVASPFFYNFGVFTLTAYFFSEDSQFMVS